MACEGPFLELSYLRRSRKPRAETGVTGSVASRISQEESGLESLPSEE